MYSIDIEEVATQPIASIRETVAGEHLVSFFDEACREIRAHLDEVGVAVTGPPFSIWHSAPEEIPGAFDVETCISVGKVVGAGGRVRSRELAAGALASTLHKGPYDTMGEAFDAVWRWIEAEGHEAAGPPRDIPLVGPDQTDNPREYLTAIVYPVSLRR